MDPLDLSWHDGRLIGLDIRFDERSAATLLADLYDPTEEPAGTRRRFRCTCSGLDRFTASGDVAELLRHRGSGEIEHMRLRSGPGDDREVLTVLLFGGHIEIACRSVSLQAVADKEAARS